MLGYTQQIKLVWPEQHYKAMNVLSAIAFVSTKRVWRCLKMGNYKPSTVYIYENGDNNVYFNFLKRHGKYVYAKWAKVDKYFPRGSAL